MASLTRHLCNNKLRGMSCSSGCRNHPPGEGIALVYRESRARTGAARGAVRPRTQLSFHGAPREGSPGSGCLARAKGRRIPGTTQRTPSLFQGPSVPGRCRRPCPEAGAPRGRARAPALTAAILRGTPSPARDVTPHARRRMTSPRPASRRRRL